VIQELLSTDQESCLSLLSAERTLSDIEALESKSVYHINPLSNSVTLSFLMQLIL